MHKQKATRNVSEDPSLWNVEPGFAMGLFHLGIPRDEVLQLLEERRLDFDPLSDSSAVYVLAMDTKLYFLPESPHCLSLIEVSNEQARFGTLKIMWQYAHDIFASIPSASTLWFADLSQINPTVPSSTSFREATDQQLLNNGTLWMKDLGVGFQLRQGRVTSLYLCDPALLPQSADGEFTGTQRHLSEELQIQSYRTPSVKTPPVERFVKVSLLLSTVFVVALFGRLAWEEKKRWDNAIEVQAEVVEVWPPPPEVFPTKFRLSYLDQHGKLHDVELSDSDLYGTPQAGDKVPLRFLPDSPQTVLGPIAFRDVGFDQFVPYFLWTIGLYLVLHIAIGFAISWLFRT